MNWIPEFHSEQNTSFYMKYNSFISAHEEYVKKMSAEHYRLDFFFKGTPLYYLEVDRTNGLLISIGPTVQWW